MIMNHEANKQKDPVQKDKLTLHDFYRKGLISKLDLVLKDQSLSTRKS